MNYDIIIIGAGISGVTLAERYASILNKKVLVLEKRNHIGGNCYDYYNSNGILVSKYGAHIFHTHSLQFNSSPGESPGHGPCQQYLKLFIFIRFIARSPKDGGI